jgi:hypothetical protein
VLIISPSIYEKEPRNNEIVAHVCGIFQMRQESLSKELLGVFGHFRKEDRLTSPVPGSIPEPVSSKRTSDLREIFQSKRVLLPLTSNHVSMSSSSLI